MANLWRMRWRWRLGCVGRGLCPEAWTVNVENWHESRVLMRAVSVVTPASTMSKQWHEGQVKAHAPHPMQVSACSCQKGDSKLSAANLPTVPESNLRSGPA